MAVTLLVTDKNLNVITDPITTWASINAEIKFNEVGGGTFTATSTPDLATAVETPGARVRLIRDGITFCAGPIEKPSGYAWDAATGDDPLTVAWADDLVLVARRLAYPDPTLAATAQVIDAYVATATNAETIIRDLVNRNVGPGALVARREPHLTIGGAIGIGTNVDVEARFTQLGDQLRDLCTAGGGIGIRVVEVGGGLVFETYQPVDRSGTVRFSAGLNNLRSIRLDHESPSATVAIVAGSGTGAARVFAERNDATTLAAWGRSETLVSSQATTTTGLNQDGDRALGEKGERYVVSAVAIDTPDQRFGIHFHLHDRVSIHTPHGVTVTDVVSAAKLSATPKGGDLMEITIGSELAATTDRRTMLLRDWERRIGLLERT